MANGSGTLFIAKYKFNKSIDCIDEIHKHSEIMKILHLHRINLD